MKTKLGIYLLFFVVTLDVVLVFGGQFQGCYKESKRKRVFHRNPGDFKPNAMTPAMCAAKCGSFSFSYAAIAEGKFCFCGDTLPDVSQKDVSNTQCTYKCSGEPATNCGSDNYVSVYSAAPPIRGLTLTSSASGAAVAVNTPVTFTVGVASAGADLAFQVNYDDGAGKTDKNATGMWQKTFQTPGLYQVSAFANDVIGSLVEKEATTTVVVNAPVDGTVLTCPAFLPTHEDSNCDVTVLEGSDMELKFYEDSVLKATFSLADPLLYETGPAIPSTGGTTLLSGEATADTIVMPASEFMYKGVLIHFEVYAEVTGNIDILILSPSCTTPPYCYDQNDCSSGCSGIHEKTCTSKEFCPSAMNCWTSGSNTCDSLPVRYDGTQRTNLNIVKTFTHNIANIGYNYIPIDTSTDYIEVEPGYVIGYKPTTGRLKAVSVSSSETDVKTSDVSNKASMTALAVSKRHLLRAVTSGGSNAYIPVNFLTPGVKDISVIVNNKQITGSQTKTAQINVNEGIDRAVMVVPMYIEKGVAVSIQLLQHTGTNVTYWYEISGGTSVNTTDNPFSHTFNTIGQHNISVNAFNPLSSKTNFTTVYVQERISSFVLYNTFAVVGEITSIPFTATTGSDYTCIWKKDNTQIATTVDTTTPPGSSYNHTFTAEGSSEIWVTCSNEINSEEARGSYQALYRITNLRLVKTGALKDQTYTIEWEWDAGSLITFTLEYNNVNMPFTIDPYFNKAKTAILGPETSITQFPLNLTAVNDVSQENIFIQFGIEEEITNPSITSSKDPITDFAVIGYNQAVTFTVDATGGTNVEIVWNYKDGTANDTASLTTWTTTQSKTHTFSSLGVFDVEVTIYNSYNSYSKTFKIMAITPIQNLGMTVNPLQVLFNPPAGVSISFTKNPADPDPYGATLYLDYGNGDDATVPFDINTVFTYDFRENNGNPFTIKANVSNIINHQVLTSSPISIVEKIEGIEITTSTEHAPFGDPVTINVKIRRADTGNTVRIGWSLGDGLTHADTDRIGVSPDGIDSITTTYNAIQTNTITITATSAMETVTQTKSITCQHKVKTDLQITSNHPRDFTTSGGVIDYSFEYTGTPKPTDATIQVNFGDGQEQTLDATWLTTGSGISQSFSHTYATDGDFVTTVVLSNLVSTETFKINSGVYKPFVDLAVTPKYKPAIPITGPDQLGFGTNNDVFPMHLPVKFHMTKSSGTHGYYSILSTSGPTPVIICNRTTESVFELNFTQTGTYGIQITAINAKYTAIVTTSVQIMNAVLNIMIADNKQPTDVNVVKVFDISFDDPGTSPCVYINYGDGTEEMYGDSATCSGSQYAGTATYRTTFAGNSFQVSHTFVTKGTYSVTAVGFNSISTTNTLVSHVVSSLDCARPTVDIQNKMPNFWEPTEIQRQHPVIVTGITSIQCGTILENIKSWTVEKVDPDDGTLVSSVDLSTINSRQKAQLDLPARFLQGGLYKLTYQMEMVSDSFTDGENFKSEAITYVKVVPSDMVAKIFSGGMTNIQRGVNQMITIAPKDYSYDPDLTTGSTQTFTNFVWQCRQVGEEWPTSTVSSLPYTTAQLAGGPTDNGGCFKQGPGHINTNAGSLTFDTGNMKVNQTYEFKVKVEKDGHKSAETSAFLKIVDGNPPIFAIRCTNDDSCRQGETGLIIRPSNWLRLLGECTNGCDENTNFKWKLYEDNYQYTWKESQELDNSANSVGVDSKSIAINNALFKPGNITNMTKYLAELTATTASGDSGTVSSVLLINTPPSGGTCNINPKEGTVLNTTFAATCDGWTDSDGIKEYQTYCKYKDDSILKQISLEQYYSGSMPLGPDYDDYNMNCFTRIKDTYGAFTEVVHGIVKVNPMSAAEFTEQMKQMEQDASDVYDQIIALGDTKKTMEVVTTFASLLSMASDSDLIEYGTVAVQSPTDMSPGGTANTSTTPLTPEEEKVMKQQYEEKREARAELTSKLLDAVSSCTVGTMSEAVQASSAIADVTESEENCDQVCQKSAANLALNFANKIEELSETSSKEDIADAVTGIFSCLGNLQQAGITHKARPTIGDKDRAKPQAQYDTELDSTKDEIPTAYFNDQEAADDALLTFTNKDIQEATSAGVDNIINSVRSKVRNIIQNHLVPGESVVIQTRKNVINFEKNDIKKLGNRKIEMNNASVNIPDMCDILPTKCDQSVSLMLESTFSVYPPQINYDTDNQISKHIGAVQLSLFNSAESGGNSLKVENTATDFEINIPLDQATVESVSSDIAPYIRDNRYFQPHKVNVSLQHASLFIEIDADDTSKQFLIVIRKGDIPDITTGAFDHSCLIGPSPGAASVADGSATNVCFMSSELINNFEGYVHFGVREIPTNELERYRTKGLVPTSFPADDTFTTNYTLSTTIASCLYYHDTSRRWKSDGCKCGPKTSTTHLQCFCNHLTTFSGGWAVAPNTIDWDFVFSNADFLQNPTLYATLIAITVFYLISVIWARRADKRDLEKLGLTPLADNEKKDKYLYEIVVVTGMRRKAGTDSKVQFILSGEYEETDVRTLSDNKRKILRRGTVDGFLMSSPRPLGPLNYLHIWHDNSGKGNFASWYLKSVVVRDVQTDEKFIFICNRWFAVEEDDGQVDRVIPVAGKEQMTEFSHLFSQKTAKSLSDGHLWFSVVARPPQSRFTRVQRVSCCLCLLYLSMLTNAMFYEKDSGTNVYTFGPFALSPEQIYIGVISNIIVFPVTFLIITLFRKSRPKTKRPSRIQTALNNTTKRATSMTDVNPTLENTREGTLTPSILLEQKNRPDTSMSRAYTSLSVDELADKPKGKKKKKWDLPWYFTIFAWILLWIATLVSAVFVLFYGIQFQDVKCKKWITSMLISFFASIFITQPIKVFLTAIIFSLIIKNPGLDDEEEEDDEEKPNIAADEQLLHDDSLYSVTRPKRAAYSPPDPALMEKARTIRMNEIKMWGVVREILFYSFFLWILMVISYRNRSELMYTYKNSMEQVFIVTNNTNHSFMKAKNMDDFWSWAKTGMVNGLRALPYYNEEQPLFLRGYINDKQSRIMGHATMRQLRVTADSCIVPDPVVGLIHECNDEYSMTNQDEKSYDIGWKPLLTGNSTLEEYRYTSAKELEGYPYWGETAMYSGGGYVVRILGNISTLRTKMSELEQQGWIDRYTRAIFIEFTVYNPGINLFSVSTMLAEFRPSQGILPSYRFEPVNLFPYMNSVMLFVLGCEIAYLLFTVFFIICEARNLYKQRLEYFREFWNLVEFGICAMSVTAVVIYFYRMFETNRLTDRFRISQGYEYMKFQYVGYWSETFSYIIGWLVFFATLKFLKLLRFNKKICLLASTMKASCKDLLHFSIIFNIVFLAFIQLFYMIYVNNIKSFKTFVTSCESGIVMMMGKFDIYEMSAAQPVLTQIFLFLYVVMITFIVVNMFLSILNETFSSVRVDNNKQSNDYEIVNFMIGRLKLWTGIGTPDRSVLKPTTIQSVDKRGPAELFPEQIDRLLNSISHIYMEKERLDELFDKNAYGKGKGADLPMFDPASIQSLKYEKMTMVNT